MNKNERFLELIEKIYNQKVREAFESQLKKKGEELIEAYPCTEAEHNWFSGNVDTKATARRILNGYVLVLRDKSRKRREISFISFLHELPKKLQREFF